jgi:hypothetical protein
VFLILVLKEGFMSKLFRVFGIAALAAAIAFSFAACGGDDHGSGPGGDTGNGGGSNPFLGTWTLTDGTGSRTITFTSNTNWILYTPDSTLSGTYTYNGNNATLHTSSESFTAVIVGYNITFTFANGTATYTRDGGGSTAPTIITTSLPGGTVGTPYNQDLTATGSAPITWSYTSGTLPPGLTFWARGALTGTPTTAGTYNFTVKATNALGSDTKTLPITITGGGGTSNLSLDGVWELDTSNHKAGTGTVVRITGSTGVFTQISSSESLWQTAKDKGFIKVGDTYFKDITKTGERTWTC